jgi:predicted unusual protein kinase regulating ubiquinone biosynthesis (AarF/ABC1/UbiB family)
VQTDAHFGNYKIRVNADQDKIILLDFGAVREFPDHYIDPFRHLVRAVLSGDNARVGAMGEELGFLYETDTPEMFELFSSMCQTALEGFSEAFKSELHDMEAKPHSYIWNDTALVDRLTNLIKDAVFTFRLRSPPREAIFLDRKLIGSYFILAKLGLKWGPRQLLLKYLENEKTST